MISCIIMGGLGNQLFQIYTTMALSLEMKTNFIFPKNKLQTDKRADTYWDSFLKELGKNTVVIDMKNMKYILYKEKEFKYNKIQIMPDLIRKNDGVMLYGYFQSYKYFDKEYKNISKYIKLDESRSEVRKMYYEKYEKSNIISLHFRMGDYKNLQNCHPILGDEYYINSIKFVLSKKQSIIKWTILYFCEEEDMDEVKIKVEKIKAECIEYLRDQEWGRGHEVDFERANSESKMEDWRQLLLMSCCQHNIIANSSFSWWAAYFNDNSEKIICYPETWFGSQLSHHNTSDLCPKSWNKINGERQITNI
jgi:hypothetical protein